jgi:hypothetical protein
VKQHSHNFDKNRNRNKNSNSNSNSNMGDDDWNIGQRLKVTCSRSKHSGRYAVVVRVCFTKLNVVFEDGRPGQFINKNRATLVPARNDNPGAETDSNMGRRANVIEDTGRGVSEITRLLDQLAVTAAALISADGHDTARTERDVDAFYSSVRDHT